MDTIIGLRLPLLTRRKKRREREIEENYRDTRSDRMIAELQERKKIAEGILRDRQRRDLWQEAVTQMIQSGRA